MDQQQKNEEKNDVQQAESLSGQQKQTGPMLGKRTKLYDTIDRQIQKPGEFGPFVVHRVRNEATEGDMPEGKWCDGENLLTTENGTILDSDVTCPDCNIAIEKVKAIQSKAEHEQQQELIPEQPEPAPELGKKPEIEFLDQLESYRQKGIELQEEKNGILRDISEALKNTNQLLGDTLNILLRKA